MPTPSTSEDTPDVSRKVEEALLFQLKQRAYSVCSAAAGAYADCCRGRTFSMAWACRTELRALSTCLGEHTNEATLTELKRRWVAAGKPDRPAWEALLEGL